MTDVTLLTLDQLHTYHHALMSALKLENDTGQYDLDASVTVPTYTNGVWTNVATTVGEALSQLFALQSRLSLYEWNADDFPFNAETVIDNSTS